MNKMVLKKSNSPFNSGVTQRFTNLGALRCHTTSRSPPGTISVSLFGLGVNSLDATSSSSSIQHALDYIYTILEWKGPDVSYYFKDDNTLKLQGDFKFNQFDLMKNNSQDMIWKLSNKLKEFSLADHSEIINTEDIEIEILIKRFIIHKRKDETVLSWSSRQIVKKGETKEDRKLKRKLALRQNQLRRRSDQRRYKKPTSSTEYDNNVMHRPEKRIEITLQEPPIKDSRLVTKPIVDKPDYHEVSRWKCKSYINGQRSRFKGINAFGLELRKKEALSDILFVSECGYCSDDDDYYCDSNEMDRNDYHFDENLIRSFEEEEECVSSSVNQYSLADYFISTQRKKICNTSVSAKETENKQTSTNSASSEQVNRYPKGAFLYAEKCDLDNNDSDSGFDSNLSLISDTISDLEEDNNISTNNDDITKNDEEQFILNISDFSSRFLQINLILPQEIQRQLISVDSQIDLPHDRNVYKCYDCVVSTGNCYPPVFTIKVGDSKNKDIYNNKYYLVCRAVELSNGDGFTWLVLIDNAMTYEIDPSIKNKLTVKLQEYQQEMPLQKLVEIFQETILTCLPADGLFESEKPTHRQKVSEIQLNPWSSLKKMMPKSAEVVSVDEAILKCQITTCNSPSDDGDMNERINNPQIMTEEATINELSSGTTFSCDICYVDCNFSSNGDSQALMLSSCKHIFCYTCWSSHAQIALRGIDPIRCMSSNCKQEMNPTLLRSLTHGYDVSRWSNRLQDKEIEKNLNCKWCPNTHCKKVAFMSEISKKVNQFGSLVSCDCELQWCFSCQSEPHWPASCDQIFASRKLLSKSDQFHATERRKTFTIELKPCPKCRYPIEKNMGCPSMVCRMCWFNFCWNCLRTVDHSVYSCTDRYNNYVTYNLHNEMDNNIPVKYFPNYVDINKKQRELKREKISRWLQSIRTSKKRWSQLSHHSDNDTLKRDAITLAQNALEFLNEVYTFLQSYYVLLSFAEKNKKNSMRWSNYAYSELSHSIQTLSFIAERIESNVLFQPLAHILRYACTANVLLQCGRDRMKEMVEYIPALQEISKNVETAGIGDLDPSKVFYYK